jgi:hypothetical protein
VDAFAIRDRLVRDYADYVRSFITVKDPRMQEYVDGVLAGDTLWPEPLIQLNPAFEPGESLHDLVADNALHAECERIFRIKTAADTIGVPMQLHRHQSEAIRIAGSATGVSGLGLVCFRSSQLLIRSKRGKSHGTR